MSPNPATYSHVAICIATYKRPDGLRKLLSEIARLDWPGQLTTIVADNDPELQQGAREAERIAESFPWRLKVLVVEDAGIPFPRNAAIEYGLSLDADLLAFIDDDEWPHSAWLQELARAIECGADLAGGPQIPVFPPGTDARLQVNPYYGHDQGLSSGEECILQSSGNFMATREILAAHGPPWFDPRYARTSGADHDLFKRLDEAGADMRWVPAAKVWEDIPTHRLDKSWMRERVIEIHNGRVRIDRTYDRGLVPKVVRVAKTTALGVQAFLWTLAGVVSSGIANEAQLVRWRFVGKVRAHLGATVDREEDRPLG